MGGKYNKFQHMVIIRAVEKALINYLSIKENFTLIKMTIDTITIQHKYLD